MNGYDQDNNVYLKINLKKEILIWPQTFVCTSSAIMNFNAAVKMFLEH